MKAQSSSVGVHLLEYKDKYLEWKMHEQCKPILEQKDKFKEANAHNGLVVNITKERLHQLLEKVVHNQDLREFHLEASMQQMVEKSLVSFKVLNEKLVKVYKIPKLCLRMMKFPKICIRHSRI